MNDGKGEIKRFRRKRGRPRKRPASGSDPSPPSPPGFLERLLGRMLGTPRAGDIKALNESVQALNRNIQALDAHVARLKETIGSIEGIESTLRWIEEHLGILEFNAVKNELERAGTDNSSMTRG
jgi:hypothetical protein